MFLAFYLITVLLSLSGVFLCVKVDQDKHPAKRGEALGMSIWALIPFLNLFLILASVMSFFASDAFTEWCNKKV